MREREAGQSQPWLVLERLLRPLPQLQAEENGGAEQLFASGSQEKGGKRKTIPKSNCS